MNINDIAEQIAKEVIAGKRTYKNGYALDTCGKQIEHYKAQQALRGRKVEVEFVQLTEQEALELEEAAREKMYSTGNRKD